MTKLVSPILLHTAEEVYKRIPHYKTLSSVHLDTLWSHGGGEIQRIRESVLHRAVERMLVLREMTSARLEDWKKTVDIKDSQDVDVILTCPKSDAEMLSPFRRDLATFFRTASVTVELGELNASFEQSSYIKCDRSRIRRPDVAVVDWNGEKIPLSQRDQRALGII